MVFYQKQRLLRGCFDGARDVASHPGDGVFTGHTEQTLCDGCQDQSCPAKPRVTMDHGMPPGLSVLDDRRHEPGERLFRWDTAIGNRQVQYLKAGLAIERWQILPRYEVALIGFGQQHDEGDRPLSKHFEPVSRGVVRAEGHGTPKNPPWEPIR